MFYIINPLLFIGANYAVRVVNRETGRRALIKGIGAMVEDLEFAFIPNQITLACVDETGSVYIHNIHEDSNEITTSLLLHIIQVNFIMLCCFKSVDLLFFSKLIY